MVLTGIRWVCVVSAWHLLASCAEPSNQSGSLGGAYATTDETKIRSNAKLPDKATNPDGGVIEKQVSTLSPEVNLQRIAKNRLQPIILGASVANISVETPLKEARSILSAPLGIDQDVYYYGENIRVIWTSNDAGDHLPEMIFVDLGYLGPLVLPEEYGQVHLGDAMTQHFPDSDPFGEAFIRKLARFFDGKDQSYDCLALRKCGIQLLSGHLRFIFQTGDLLFRRNEALTLDIVIIVPPPPPETAPLLDPIIFGTGAAGVTFDDSRTEVISKLGQPIAVDFLGIHQFDNGYVEIFFDNSTEEMKSINIRFGYQGVLQMPTDLGQVKMGHSFASHFNEEDPFADQLLMKIGRFMDGKTSDPSYDCRKVNSCAMEQGFGVLFLSFDLGELVITSDSQKTLESVTLVPPGLPRTAPLTTVINFPDGIGAFTMASTKAAVEAVVGDSRGTFTSNGKAFEIYDNENIYIGYDEDGTPSLVQIGPQYQGAIDFPVAYGTVKLGDTFDDQFPSDDVTGEDFIVELGAHFLGEDPSTYNCLTENTCAIESGYNIYFLFEAGRLIFDILDKRLLYVIIDEDQELPTD